MSAKEQLYFYFQRILLFFLSLFTSSDQIHISLWWNRHYLILHECLYKLKSIIVHTSRGLWEWNCFFIYQTLNLFALNSQTILSLFFLFFYVIVYFYCLKCIGILAKSLQIYRYNRVLYISKHISKLYNHTYLALLWNRAKKVFHSNIKLMQFFSCELKAHQSVVLKLFK